LIIDEIISELKRFLQSRPPNFRDIPETPMAA